MSEAIANISDDASASVEMIAPLDVAATEIQEIKAKPNQDCKQKIAMIPTVLFELYRVMVSSFLILFVPQKCDDHVCELSENFVFENGKYATGVIFNFITMAGFIGLYYLEVKRENRLITYLEVSADKANDNTSVGNALKLLAVDKKDSILYLDKCYQKWGYTMLFVFCVNAIMSGFVVYDYYLANQTTSAFITNILFVVTKLIDIYSIANTEQNVFYSAYLKDRIQYNDVDPDKKVLLIENTPQV